MSFKDRKDSHYTRIATHRNRRRLWLEGRRLVRSGFVRGARYRLVVDAEQGYARFVLDPEGDRAVSARKPRGANAAETPIIDLCSEELLPAGTRVRVDFHRGAIEVTLHHEERARLSRERRLIEHLAGGEVREGSLFTGGGVSTHALHQGLSDAGIGASLEYVVEREAKYLEASNPVLEDAQMVVGSVEEVEADLLAPVDVLSLSMPCDGHSKSGKAKLGLANAEAHPKSATALFGVYRIIDAANPSVIVSENVVDAASSATYALLIKELERRGYLIQEVVLDGEDAGTLENRRRWFFVAVSRGLAEGFDIERIAPQPRLHERLGEILEDIPEADERWRELAYLKEKERRDIASGNNFRRNLVDEASTEVGVIGRGYSKYRSTEPMVNHPRTGKQRLLTPAEHAAVKGAPAGLVDGLANSVAHEVLGQSVLYPHLYAIGRLIGDHFRVLRLGAQGEVLEGQYQACENPRKPADGSQLRLVWSSPSSPLARAWSSDADEEAEQAAPGAG